MPLGSVVLEVGAADEPVFPEQREHVVAVDPLGLALVDLDHVAEAEDALEERPVPDEVVERREEQRGRHASVRLDVGGHEHGRLAVLDLEPAELALGDERVGMRPDARGAAAQAPHLRDGGVRERAARADAAQRRPADELVARRRRRVEHVCGDETLRQS